MSNSSSSSSEEKGQVQLFLENHQKLPPSLQKPYIVMLSIEIVPDFSLDSHPYSAFVSKKGTVNWFKFTKALVTKEIKRRDPNAKPNSKNKKLEELLKSLKLQYGHKLTEKDKAFIIKKEKELRNELVDELKNSNSGSNNNNNNNYNESTVKTRLGFTWNDRLRVAALLSEQDIKAAFLQSLKDSDDDGGSGSGGGSSENRNGNSSSSSSRTFEELAVAKFNDSEWTVSVPSMPKLHVDYIQPQVILKGDLTLTEDKLRDIMKNQRKKLKKIAADFNKNGNGENRVGEHDDTCQVKEGGKRKSFLKGQSSDLLYWWYIMDQQDLLEKYFASGGQAVNSSASASTTSPNRKRNAATAGSADQDDDSQRKRKKISKTLARQMAIVNGNVQDSKNKKPNKLSRTMARQMVIANTNMVQLNQADFSNQLNQLQDKKYELFLSMCKHTQDLGLKEGEKPPSSDVVYAAMEGRYQEIDQSIGATQSRLKACNDVAKEIIDIDSDGSE